jgi:hypothetical protein
MLSNQEKKERLTNLRIKMERELQSQLQSKPKITPYEMKREYISPEERATLNQVKKFKIPKRLRETSKQRKECLEFEECTFAPKINNGYSSPNKDVKNRSIEKLIEWGEEKDIRLINKRMNS